MTNDHVIKIDADGNVHCLYSDALPLREMGSLTVERASNVEFDQERDGWVVIFPPRDPEDEETYLRQELNGKWVRIPYFMFAEVFKSREQALAAEVNFLQSHL